MGIFGCSAARTGKRNRAWLCQDLPLGGKFPAPPSHGASGIIKTCCWKGVGRGWRNPGFIPRMGMKGTAKANPKISHRYGASRKEVVFFFFLLCTKKVQDTCVYHMAAAASPAIKPGLQQALWGALEFVGTPASRHLLCTEMRRLNFKIPAQRAAKTGEQAQPHTRATPSRQAAPGTSLVVQGTAEKHGFLLQPGRSSHSPAHKGCRTPTKLFFHPEQRGCLISPGLALSSLSPCHWGN